MITTIKLHSNFLNFVNVSTYSGIFDTCMFFDYYYQQMPEFIEPDNFNMKEFTNEILDYYLDVLDTELLSKIPYIKGMDEKSAEFYQPKFYNFSNDSFSVDLKIDKDILLERLDYLLTNHIDTCSDFLAEHWESCDGFISFMPQNIEELKECEEMDKILAFVLNIDYILDFECDFEYNTLDYLAYEEMYGNCSVYDFETFHLNRAPSLYSDYPVLKYFNNFNTKEIRQYILDNTIATNEQIEAIMKMTLSNDVMEILNIENEDFMDMEMPVDSEEIALFLVLYLNNITELDI